MAMNLKSDTETGSQTGAKPVVWAQILHSNMAQKQSVFVAVCAGELCNSK